MNIANFSTHAFFEGVENKVFVRRVKVKDAIFVHGKRIVGPHTPVNDIALRILANHYPEYTLPMIKGPSRNHGLVKARRHIWTAVRDERPDLSGATIARLFNRDHATVIVGIRRYREIISNER